MTRLKEELDELLQLGNTVDQLSKEKSIATKRNALLKATKEKFENIEVEAIYDKILFQHGIHFHKYHGKTLTGDHCATFINKIDEITRDVNTPLSSIIEGSIQSNLVKLV